MRVYKNTTVLQEAQKRVSYIFDNFKNVVVGLSGGKDSTVVLNLALAEARKRNRVPLPVVFIDQEAEWQGTIDYVRECMSKPDVTPMWFQMPMKIFNAVSTEQQWLQCWEPNGDWMREKEAGAITENIYGTDRFAELFTQIMKHHWPNEPAAYIAGVRTEESPSRYVGLTNSAVYKWITWGKMLNKKRQHITFYPIYDWSYTDVWKAIFDHKWNYCHIYDKLYMYGVPPMKMRISNLHHETAIATLFHLQEIEKETYNKLTQRLKGIDSAGKLGEDDFFVRDLPFMFGSWKEYRDFLIEKLIKQEQQQIFRNKFIKMDELYSEMADPDILTRVQVGSVIANDYHFTKINNFERSPQAWAYRKSLTGHEFEVRNDSYGKYIKQKK